MRGSVYEDGTGVEDLVKIYITHVYDAAGHLHDYYAHASAEGALREAAADVVAGRFPQITTPGYQAEIERVIGAVAIEPGVGRRHVRCDAWRAHIDEMLVRK